MAKREHYSGFEYNQLVDPAITSIDVNGSSIDTLGFDSTTIVFIVGASDDTLSSSVYVELELEDSPDDSAWTDCANADLTNFETGTTNTGTVKKVVLNDDDALYATGYKGDKRYVRPVLNVTGMQLGIDIGVIGVNGHPHNSPVNAPT